MQLQCQHYISFHLEEETPQRELNSWSTMKRPCHSGSDRSVRMEMELANSPDRSITILWFYLFS